MLRRFTQTPIVNAAAGLAAAIVLLVALVVILLSIEPASAKEIRAENRSSDATVMARLRISIPFGIEAVQEVSENGESLSLTGHGFCWEESQLFDLRVRVAQSSTHAFAESHSIEVCMGGERQTWNATAESGSVAAFEPGPARACAEAVEFAKHGIADERAWCKDVELTYASDEGY